MGKVAAMAAASFSQSCHPHPSFRSNNSERNAANSPNFLKWKKKRRQINIITSTRPNWEEPQPPHSLSSNNDHSHDHSINTFSASISTDVPLYEPPGVSFDEYIMDRPRIFKAMFPDKARSKRLNDEEWRIQMLPINFFLASVSPVVVMRLICRSQGKDYPPAVPLHVTKVLELQATRWELKGLDGISMPSHFHLSVQGALYPVRKGSRSCLKGHLKISISLALPPVLELVPKDVLKGVTETVLTRLLENMKQEVDASLISDFRNYGREKLNKHGQTTLPPATTTTLGGETQTKPQA